MAEKQGLMRKTADFLKNLDYGELAEESLPIVGETAAIKRASTAFKEGDYLGTGIEAAAGLLGVVPFVGDIAGKALRTATKKYTKAEIKDAAPTWFKETPVSKDIKPEDAIKTQREITTATYVKAKDMLPEGKTLDFGAGKGIGAKKVKFDTYEPFPEKSFSPKYTDAKSIPSNSYDNVTSLNVLNVVKPETRSAIVQDIGRILKPGGTGIITTRGMGVFGDPQQIIKGVLADEPRAVITSIGTYQKGFRKKELLEYIQEELGNAFTVSGVKLGDAGVKIIKKSKDLSMAEGGAVTMNKQMDMFREGGLNQEGGMIDAESGNEVPVGSTREEVRDDIPAKLSEGEFVMPADVVRYHGLDKMMALRDEAKMGLQKMNAMGQMGNSEEATLPEEMPFGMADLMVVAEDGREVEMAEGGYVTMANGGDPSSNVRQLGPTYRPPVSQPINFSDVMGEAKLSYKEYRNAQGNNILVAFIGGKPLYPIPEGYTEYTAGADEPVTPIQDLVQQSPPIPESNDNDQINRGYSLDDITNVSAGMILEEERRQNSVFGKLAMVIATAVGGPVIGAAVGLAKANANKKNLARLKLLDQTPEVVAAIKRSEESLSSGFMKILETGKKFLGKTFEKVLNVIDPAFQAAAKTVDEATGVDITGGIQPETGEPTSGLSDNVSAIVGGMRSAGNLKTGPEVAGRYKYSSDGQNVNLDRDMFGDVDTSRSLYGGSEQDLDLLQQSRIGNELQNLDLSDTMGSGPYMDRDRRFNAQDQFRVGRQSGVPLGADSIAYNENLQAARQRESELGYPVPTGLGQTQVPTNSITQQAASTGNQLQMGALDSQYSGPNMRGSYQGNIPPSNMQGPNFTPDSIDQRGPNQIVGTQPVGTKMLDNVGGTSGRQNVIKQDMFPPMTYNTKPYDERNESVYGTGVKVNPATNFAGMDPRIAQRGLAGMQEAGNMYQYSEPQPPIDMSFDPAEGEPANRAFIPPAPSMDMSFDPAEGEPANRAFSPPAPSMDMSFDPAPYTPPTLSELDSERMMGINDPLSATSSELDRQRMMGINNPLSTPNPLKSSYEDDDEGFDSSIMKSSTPAKAKTAALPRYEKGFGTVTPDKFNNLVPGLDLEPEFLRDAEGNPTTTKNPRAGMSFEYDINDPKSRTEANAKLNFFSKTGKARPEYILAGGRKVDASSALAQNDAENTASGYTGTSQSGVAIGKISGENGLSGVVKDPLSKGGKLAARANGRTVYKDSSGKAYTNSTFGSKVEVKQNKDGSWGNKTVGGKPVKYTKEAGVSSGHGTAQEQDNSDNESGSGKIICTAMNASYGFGSYRQAVWLNYSNKHLTKEHEVGYHTLFLPLVHLAYTKDNKLIRKLLEHGTRRRTADIRAELKGTKRNTLGRIYRAVLEPLCYGVGKIKMTLGE